MTLFRTDFKMRRYANYNPHGRGHNVTHFRSTLASKYSKSIVSNKSNKNKNHEDAARTILAESQPMRCAQILWKVVKEISRVDNDCFSEG